MVSMVCQQWPRSGQECLDVERPTRLFGGRHDLLRYVGNVQRRESRHWSPEVPCLALASLTSEIVLAAEARRVRLVSHRRSPLLG
jgi:hypothetical protein